MMICSFQVLVYIHVVFLKILLDDILPFDKGCLSSFFLELFSYNAIVVGLSTNEVMNN